MIEMKTSVRLTFRLGILSAVAIIISNLALIDISHGESNLILEWRIMHLSYAIFLLFHISALFTLGRILKQRIGEKSEQ